jgi:hypothetical protein
MTKQRTLPVRALGAEPGLPDIPMLAEWVAEHHGKSGDLISFQLNQSLAPQLPAGVSMPCCGGIFYQDRIMECLIGIQNNRAVNEIGIITTAVIEDMATIIAQKKGVWCALPAPHLLGIQDAYYGDKDELNDAINGVYRTLMRSMRDAGIAGHVLICDQVDDAEISALTRQKVFFFHPRPDRECLQTLMEYQRQVAVDTDHLDVVFDLSNEYDLHQVIVMNPDKESIALSLSRLDPDQVMAGGYCTEGCEQYWKSVVDSAVYLV